MENKIFFGLGIITVISGILLTLQHDYFIGIPGSIVGMWLTVDNFKKINSKKAK